LDQFGANFTNLILKPQKGWLNLRLSWEFLVKKPDLFLGLGQALPLFHPVKSIVLVYDLAFEHYPNCYKDTHLRLSRQTKYAVKQSDKIVAISNSTKDDLVKCYNIDEGKIEVIYPGADPIFSTPGESLRATPGVSCPYFLFIGSLKPIKNVPRIIEAFSLFLKKTKKRYELVLAGSDFWPDEEIMAVIKRLKMYKQISILGFVEREDLPPLYRGAKALVVPSLYEGFGLPILEAMAAGIPVVGSASGGIPDFLKDGRTGLLCDPRDPEDIADNIQRLLTDENLRHRVVQAGRELVKSDYDWDKIAPRYAELYPSI